MRFPRVRFTIRRMIVAVAIISLLIAALMEIQNRRARFLKIAQSHSSWEQDRLWFAGNGRVQELVGAERRRWRLEMGKKYLEAARHPWIPVSSDPPEPK